MIKNVSKKCNTTIWKTTSNKTTQILLKLFVMINEHFTKIMINLETIKCFMSQNFVCRKEIISEKKNIYKLINIKKTIIEQKIK